jgi:hypothetical protein
MKKLPSQLVLIILTSMAFLILSITHGWTQPIMDTRLHQQFLTLLNIDAIQGLTIEEQQPTSITLQEEGVVRFQIVYEQDAILGIVYDIETSGYASGLHFQVGIKDGEFQRILFDQSNETQGYGSRLLVVLPTLLEGVSVTNESLLTSMLVGQSTGITATFNGVHDALLLVAKDYRARVQ